VRHSKDLCLLCSTLPKRFRDFISCQTHCKWFRVPRSIAGITHASTFSRNTSGAGLFGSQFNTDGPVTLPRPFQVPHTTLFLPKVHKGCCLPSTTTHHFAETFWEVTEQLRYILHPSCLQMSGLNWNTDKICAGLLEGCPQRKSAYCEVQVARSWIIHV
jgi:hypothetical protein